MVRMFHALLFGALVLTASPVRAESLNIAAASSMRFVLPLVIEHYQSQQPTADIRVVYGSSGRLYGQLSHGAPFHIFMSANMEYAEQLLANNNAVGDVQAYADGRLAFWWQGAQSHTSAADILAAMLAQPRARIAIASPQHAPYGVQSLAWLQQHQHWADIEPRLVYTESVAQVAHFVRSGAASVGILALALAVTDELAAEGQYLLIPPHEYQPLRKGMVITQAGGKHPYAAQFFAYMQTPAVRRLLEQGGFASVTGLEAVSPNQQQALTQ